MSNAAASSLPPPAQSERYLNRSDAAKFVRDRYGRRLSRQTLAKYATLGGGPIYRKFGTQAAYAEADLIAWCESKLTPRRASSSSVVLDLQALPGPP